MPAGTYGGQVGKHAAAADDELVRRGRGASENASMRRPMWWTVGRTERWRMRSPSARSAGRYPEEAEQLGSLGPGCEETALSGLPQDSDEGE
ncbi:hypothetical protein [Streptomyces formicae]|uniref:Uncharacterized protein n=1 Tax=Streptomyces formicae TaxID=1616117 RepID=A0ABY3WLE0_9ACTN|nr:hypothetical protein [Streptomyces formicae]UNM12279.1 hypothetical protein J4032_12710 [Streptomyces formicae]